MLKEKAVRTEATELMDRLIESVMIYPDDANGPEAEIVAIVYRSGEGRLAVIG